MRYDYGKFAELCQQELELEAYLRDAQKRVQIANALVRLHGDRVKVHAEARQCREAVERIELDLAVVTKEKEKQTYGPFTCENDEQDDDDDDTGCKEEQEVRAGQDEPPSPVTRSLVTFADLLPSMREAQPDRDGKLQLIVESLLTDGDPAVEVTLLLA